MNNLWDDDAGIFFNYRTDLGTHSERLSPTIFYPLLADIKPEKRAIRIVDYFYNADKFYGNIIGNDASMNDISAINIYGKFYGNVEGVNIGTITDLSFSITFVSISQV